MPWYLRVGGSFSNSDRKAIRAWGEHFHLEVHGSRFTIVEAFEHIRATGTLPVLPDPESEFVEIYLNSSSMIAWLLLRTLPYLQLAELSFGKDWADKWKVLDEAFHQRTTSLHALGKEIAGAILHLVEVRFGFSPESTCYQKA